MLLARFSWPSATTPGADVQLAEGTRITPPVDYSGMSIQSEDDRSTPIYKMIIDSSLLHVSSSSLHSLPN